MSDTPQKKTRTPKDPNSILVGALKLTLQQKVELVKKLKDSIAAEVKSRDESAKQAAEIVNGL